MCVTLLEFIPICLWAIEQCFSAAVIPQSQSALARRRGEKQLLQIIISICLNLLERHTGRPGRLRWRRLSRPPKRHVKPTYAWHMLSDMSKLIWCSVQVKTNVKNCLQMLVDHPLPLVLGIFTFRSPFPLTLASTSMSLLYSLPPCLTFWGCKRYTLLPVTEETDRRGAQPHSNDLDFQAVASERGRNQSGPRARDRRCYLSLNCHWKAIR